MRPDRTHAPDWHQRYGEGCRSPNLLFEVECLPLGEAREMGVMVIVVHPAECAAGPALCFIGHVWAVEALYETLEVGEGPGCKVGGHRLIHCRLLLAAVAASQHLDVAQPAHLAWSRGNESSARDHAGFERQLRREQALDLNHRRHSARLVVVDDGAAVVAEIDAVSAGREAEPSLDIEIQFAADFRNHFDYAAPPSRLGLREPLGKEAETRPPKCFDARRAAKRSEMLVGAGDQLGGNILWQRIRMALCECAKGMMHNTAAQCAVRKRAERLERFQPQDFAGKDLVGVGEHALDAGYTELARP